MDMYHLTVTQAAKILQSDLLNENMPFHFRQNKIFLLPCMLLICVK